MIYHDLPYHNNIWTNVLMDRSLVKINNLVGDDQLWHGSPLLWSGAEVDLTLLHPPASQSTSEDKRTRWGVRDSYNPSKLVRSKYLILISIGVVMTVTQYSVLILMWTSLLSVGPPTYSGSENLWVRSSSCLRIWYLIVRMSEQSGKQRVIWWEKGYGSIWHWDRCSSCGRDYRWWWCNCADGPAA